MVKNLNSFFRQKDLPPGILVDRGQHRIRQKTYYDLLGFPIGVLVHHGAPFKSLHWVYFETLRKILDLSPNPKEAEASAHALATMWYVIGDEDRRAKYDAMLAYAAQHRIKIIGGVPENKDWNPDA